MNHVKLQFTIVKLQVTIYNSKVTSYNLQLTTISLIVKISTNKFYNQLFEIKIFYKNYIGIITSLGYQI